MDLGAELRRLGFTIRTDHRAHLHDRYLPTEIRVITTTAPKWADAVNQALAMDARPCLVLDFDGNGWALSQGGSGVILVRVPVDDPRPDNRQQETIEATRSILLGDAAAPNAPLEVQVNMDTEPPPPDDTEEESE